MPKQRSPIRNWLEYGAALAVIGSLRFLPRALAEPLSRNYARWLDRAIPRLRKVAERNLALTGMPASLADGVFDSIARLLLAFARFPEIDRKNVGEWIRYDGFEHYEEAKRRGKGVLFATAHLGNWELSAFAHALLAEPMWVVVRPLDNPLIDRLVARRRALSGNRVFEKKDFARGILAALKRNEAVGILVDQNAAIADGLFVEFFGVPACVSPSFAKLAAHTGAAVIPGFAVWDRAARRYVLKFYPILEMTGDAQEDTRRVQGALERAIREYPDQWLWIHRRWKTRPPGEAEIY